MTARELAVESIKSDEGFSPFVYKCPAGKMTIGYGRNVDPAGGKGISVAEAEANLLNDIVECEQDLMHLFPLYLTFSPRRQATLVNLRFQLGAGGIRDFKNMIDCANARDWSGAARELRDSSLYRQTPKRTERRAKELEAG